MDHSSSVLTQDQISVDREAEEAEARLAGI